MRKEEIAKAVRDITVKAIPATTDEIDALTVAILNLDREMCKTIINRVIDDIGFEQSISELIYPIYVDFWIS